MKVYVAGAQGTLGRRVAAVANNRGHEVETCRISIDSGVSVMRLADVIKPDVIINCAGVVPSAGAHDVDMVRANALGPHNLAHLGIRLVHMSTDAVFSGIYNGRMWLSSSSLPAPKDLYGRSKLAGESQAAHVLIVRGSFVDWGSGLLGSLKANRFEEAIDGWSEVMWNGGTASEVARYLVTLAEGDETGTIHLSRRTTVSKYDILRRAVTAANLQVKVNPVRSPIITRALVPDVEITESWEEFFDVLRAEYQEVLLRGD